jgi:hypothetical protein
VHEVVRVLVALTQIWSVRGLGRSLRNIVIRGFGRVWCCAICVCNEILKTTLCCPSKRTEVSCDVSLRYVRSGHTENLQLVLANVAFLGVCVLAYCPLGTRIVDRILQVRSLGRPHEGRAAFRRRQPDITVHNFLLLCKCAEHERSALLVRDEAVLLAEVHVVVTIDDITNELMNKPVHSSTFQLAS